MDARLWKRKKKANRYFPLQAELLESSGVREGVQKGLDQSGGIVWRQELRPGKGEHSAYL